MRWQACVLSVILACGIGATAISVSVHAEETTQRTLRGTVIATNVDTDPPTIVVSVPLPNKEELIIGARVLQGTNITRQKQTARLAELKIGETVEITYLKTPDGLIARSIHIR